MTIPYNRQLSILFFCLFLGSLAQAQVPFKDEFFRGVKVIDSVPYAQAINFGGNKQTLHMDIYLPDSLDNRERPLIILGHGGTFLSGNRKLQDMQVLCSALALRGYICASIDYRKGINLLRDFKTEFTKAVWRATQDHRTAVRFFRSSYARGNLYHIDTSQIYIGGVSAGAIASLHVAFQTDTSEIPDGMPVQSLGGLYAGDHSGFSSAVHGVINLYGAISDKSYIDYPPGISICNLHGSSDRTVPYKSGIYAPNNIEIGELHGSFVVDSIARKLGMSSSLKTLKNKGHVPYTTEKNYIDTTLDYVVDCMFDKVRLGPVVSVQKIQANNESLHLRFNTRELEVEMGGEPSEYRAQLFDFQGRLILDKKGKGNSCKVPIGSLVPGSYFIHIQRPDGIYSRKFNLK